MTCPKCAAEQPDGGVECRVCGVVFERFLAAQERARLADSGVYRPAAVDVTPTDPTISPTVLIAIVVLVVLAGSAWTISHRRGRAERQARVRAAIDQKMTEVNRQMAAAEARMAEARMRVHEVQSRTENDAELAANDRLVLREPLLAGAGTPVWPPGLTESRARELIERCAAFSQPLVVEFPKSVGQLSYLTQRTNADLQEAARRGLIEIDRSDPSEVFVRVLPTGWSRAPIRDAGATYVLDFGRPRVATIRNVTMRDTMADVRYSWRFAHGDATGFIAVDGPLEGSAQFEKQGSSWTAVSARASYDGRSVSSCR